MPLPKFIFNLPPEEIIKFFEAKYPQVSWDWDDLWQDAHMRSFTVAKAMKLDILQTIQESMEEAMKSGILFKQWQREMQPKLKALGWWGKMQAQDVPGYDPASGVDPEKEVQLGSPWRLKTIFDTNIETSYSRKRWQQQTKAAATHPYLQYVAVLDDKTRPDHRVLDGKVFPIDYPFWKYFYPPNGWGCRCRVVQLTAEQVKKRGLQITQTGPNNFGVETYTSKNGPVKSAWFGDKMTKIRPDPGWAYNPGMTDWAPDLKKYPRNLRDLYKNDKLPDLKTLRP